MAKALTHSARAALVRLAQHARKRLDFAIAALGSKDEDEGEVRVWAKLARRTYDATHGSPRTRRWLAFVSAVERVTAKATEAESDPTLAARVVAVYGETHEDFARRLKPSKVEAVIAAWRGHRKYWPEVHEALADVVPNGPSADSMRKMWSRKTVRTPWMAPSRKYRPRRHRRQ